MIRVTPDLEIDENEIQFDFIRASGPGGQKVNKTASAVQLRFDAIHSASLPEEVRKRLLRLAHNRVNTDGELIIEASQYRTQGQNREEAIQRLVDLVRQAAHRPKRRRRTKPSQASKERRLKEKRRRSETKRLRRSPPPLE